MRIIFIKSDVTKSDLDELSIIPSFHLPSLYTFQQLDGRLDRM